MTMLWIILAGVLAWGVMTIFIITWILIKSQHKYY
jgi:hypothetical protein